GMDPGLLQRDFASLSGGEQTRALISSLFLKEGAFALIDEPTNHLDLEGRALLGEYLAAKEGFILVSHDRYFLDLCVDHILSIDNGNIRINQGNYSQWKENREREEQFQRRQDEKLKREINELERAARKRRAWADRKEKEKIGGGDKGFIGHRTAKLMKQALSIERRIEQRIEEKQELLKNVEQERRLKIYTGAKPPQTVLFVDDVTIKIENQPIVEDLSLTLHRGERIALLGPNGSGKTTLLRAICGEIEVAKGSIYVPQYLTVARAYQDPLWQEGYLRDKIREGGIDETQFRTIMALLGVTGEIFERPLQTFSEGERKKVDLCRSFLAKAHLFLWDEPLNYLDVATREQIEKLILEGEPTMLFVEHDRYFIERVATGVVRLAPTDSSPEPS
ncbi:MAG: ATP-binding cassette domain-containing protein, partial [Candidatus Bipolaricaulia bacterium]